MSKPDNIDAAKYFDVCIPVQRPPVTGKKRWMRIGSATRAADNGCIACNFYAVPLAGWGGEFFLFPAGEAMESE